jgi:AraC-like DNA-binding protein
MTGFSDEFHFSKAFKERYGIPPGEFRHRVSRSVSSETLHPP